MEAIVFEPSSEAARSADASLNEAAHGWICLFAQLCGVGSPSGRIAVLPAGCAEFALGMLGELEPLQQEGDRVLPPSLETPLQKKMVNGRNKAIIGFVVAKKARRWLQQRVLRQRLELKLGGPAVQYLLHGFDALVRTHDGGDGAKYQVVRSAGLLSLIAVIYSATQLEKEAAAEEGAEAAAEGGHGVVKVDVGQNTKMKLELL